MLTVSEIESGAALVALGSEWGALIEEAPEATPFQSFEWVEPFWRHCGGGALFVLVAREGGELVGVLPVLITRTLGLRRVVFIGAGPTDYFNLVARAGREDEVRQAFLDH